MTKHLIFSLFFILLTTAGAFSQDTNANTQLAKKYFDNKEFEKASAIYKELYSKTKADFYFDYHITCLAELNRFKEAEKDIKKEIRRQRGALQFYAGLSYIYKKQGEPEKAEKVMEDLMGELSGNRQQIFKLANALVRRKEYDYAIQVYTEAEKILSRSFNREIANVYSIQRKYPEMIEKYLDWISENPKHISSVKTRFQYFVNHDSNDNFYNTLRVQLLWRIQKRKAPIYFNQLLMWLFIQKKYFAQALVQAKAIDRRIFSSGRGIYNLAEAAKNNQEYSTAVDAYQYLISKGTDNYFYIDAKLGVLDVYYQQISEGTITSPKKINAIEEEYMSTLNTFGLSENTIESIINLAQLQSFWLNKPEKADSLLLKATELQGLSPLLKGKCNIARADILVYRNDIWQAALVYARAERDNEDNPVGDRAKLKKARMAYFAGEFEWANAQFDALKKSTSKPVANDALKYSMLIKEYGGEEDSIKAELKSFSEAELYIFRHKNDSALAVLDSLINYYPQHPIIVQAFLLKAEIYTQETNYSKAETYYKKVITERGDAISSPSAIYKLAVLYEEKILNKKEAVHYYKKLILEHPGSIYVTDGSKRLRRLRGD